MSRKEFSAIVVAELKEQAQQLLLMSNGALSAANKILALVNVAEAYLPDPPSVGVSRSDLRKDIEKVAQRFLETLEQAAGEETADAGTSSASPAEPAGEEAVKASPGIDWRAEHQQRLKEGEQRMGLDPIVTGVDLGGDGDDRTVEAIVDGDGKLLAFPKIVDANRPALVEPETPSDFFAPAEEKPERINSEALAKHVALSADELPQSGETYVLDAEPYILSGTNPTSIILDEIGDDAASLPAIRSSVQSEAEVDQGGDQRAQNDASASAGDATASSEENADPRNSPCSPETKSSGEQTGLTTLDDQVLDLWSTTLPTEAQIAKRLEILPGLVRGLLAAARADQDERSQAREGANLKALKKKLDEKAMALSPAAKAILDRPTPSPAKLAEEADECPLPIHGRSKPPAPRPLTPQYRPAGIDPDLTADERVAVEVSTGVCVVDFERGVIIGYGGKWTTPDARILRTIAKLNSGDCYSLEVLAKAGGWDKVETLQRSLTPIMERMRDIRIEVKNVHLVGVTMKRIPR